MDNLNKKQLINKYKHQEIEMGLIEMYNKINGYSLVEISTNLYKTFESIKFQLNLGRFKIKELQKDWTDYGEKAFEFKIVEKLKTSENSSDKERIEDLKELLNIWIESHGEKIKLYK